MGHGAQRAHRRRRKTHPRGLKQAFAEGYDVSLAASADEAFNLMDTQPFDVILTDLRMPGKSGLKVIDRALALPISRPSS
jgi:two-component system, NtrC family, response regulator AtoC